ncbi:MAG TPA: hypothetical protein VJ782_02185 [Aeromicrobium sp.]|nr:hypothetical protein [Aeromicrobium sp.]
MKYKNSRLHIKLRYWFSRWPLANQLNRLSWMCWCDLVDWALAGRKPRDERQRLVLDDGGDRYRVLNRTSADGCRIDAAAQGVCYCGKFRTLAAQEQYGMGPGIVVEASDGAS